MVTLVKEILNVFLVPLKISINVWECYYMCEEELSKGSLTKSVPEPCSRNNLCGSYHHIENYNGRPVYKVTFMTKKL